MIRFVCTEPDILHDADGAPVAKKRYLSASAGIFALRRAHYFNETGDSSGIGKPVNRARDDGASAEQKALAYKLCMVVNIAKRFTNRDAALFDLIREQNPGLIQALEQGGGEGRFCFSAYATQYILQYIERAIPQQNGRTSSCITDVSATDIPSLLVPIPMQVIAH